MRWLQLFHVVVHALGLTPCGYPALPRIVDNLDAKGPDIIPPRVVETTPPNGATTVDVSQPNWTRRHYCRSRWGDRSDDLDHPHAAPTG